MKNKTKNKLARNTVRVRKKQRAQEGEKTKKKPNKRLFVRVGSIVACMLLVGALAVPCFADYNPTPNPDDGAPGISDDNNGSPDLVAPAPVKPSDIKQWFYMQYSLSTDHNDALAFLMDSIYWSEEFCYVYQFTLPSVNSAVTYDEPITFNDINTANTSTCVVDKRNNSLYYFDIGHWQTQYTTSGTSRIIFYKYYAYDGENFNDVLSIRIKYDYITYLITESSISSTLYPINGTNPEDFSIATACGYTDKLVIDYGVSTRQLYFEANENYYNYEEGAYDAYNEGYQFGYGVGYTDGYNEGKTEWHERGLDEGYYLGYTNGYFDGYDKGYDDGFLAGEDSGEAYERGYNSAVADIESGDFGRNLLGASFGAPLDGLKEFVLIDWTTESGQHVTVDLMTIFSAIIGVSLFIWFLKLFAGG